MLLVETLPRNIHECLGVTLFRGDVVEVFCPMCFHVNEKEWKKRKKMKNKQEALDVLLSRLLYKEYEQDINLAIQRSQNN